jgi:hypothetical protein
MRALAGLSVLIAFVGCGGGGYSNPDGPAPPPSPTNPYRFTMTTAGVSPKELVVPPGARVLFVNNDSRRRNMTSDPHPEHDECVEINDVGFINVGQSKETGNLVAVRTCGFHDHDDPDNNNVKGRIVIRP